MPALNASSAAASIMRRSRDRRDKSLTVTQRGVVAR
jgi:hypothetical protein